MHPPFSGLGRSQESLTPWNSSNNVLGVWCSVRCRVFGPRKRRSGLASPESGLMAAGSGAACPRCARGRMCRCVLQPRLSVGPQTGLAGFAASTAFASMAAGVSRGGWALARRTGSIAGEFYSSKLVKLYSNCVCFLFAAGFRVRGGCRSGFVILGVTILCEWRTVAGASRMAAGSGVAGSRCARGRIGHWRRALLVTPRTSLAAFCQTNARLGRGQGMPATQDPVDRRPALPRGVLYVSSALSSTCSQAPLRVG